MCDTLVALGNATRDGSVIFAKNSDREPNEAHELVLVPRTTHPPGSKVRCTYVEIPQVEETNTVLLARPFWIWGAEMGANEHGVVIGNEAVFTKIPARKEPGLIGMDFLRLALERAATAREALEVITSLLETYGQGGNCGYLHPMYYHNGFLIADPVEAWVLETADVHWAAEKVRDIRTISNRVTIGKDFDLESENLVQYAVDQGWCKSRDDFNFGDCYNDFLYTTFGDSNARYSRTTDILKGAENRIDLSTMRLALRDHGEDSGPDFIPGKGIGGADICMHASYGPIRGHQSCGSMISQVTPEHQTHWLTGTSAPCTGIFKPVWIDSGLPNQDPSPRAFYNAESLWWQHEYLHRSVLKDYRNRLPVYEIERNAMEDSFIARAEALQDASPDERHEFSAECFRAARDATKVWTKAVRSRPREEYAPPMYRRAWTKFNELAGMPDMSAVLPADH